LSIATPSDASDLQDLLNDYEWELMQLQELVQHCQNNNE